MVRQLRDGFFDLLPATLVPDDDHRDTVFVFDHLELTVHLQEAKGAPQLLDVRSQPGLRVPALLVGIAPLVVVVQHIGIVRRGERMRSEDGATARKPTHPGPPA